MYFIENHDLILLFELFNDFFIIKNDESIILNVIKPQIDIPWK